MKNSVIQMNANEGNLKYEYSRLDKYFENNPPPRELAMYLSRLHAGLADILAQVVSYMHADGEYNFYIRGEITGGIFQLMDFFEVLAELKEAE